MLPLFPLKMVAYPGEKINLHIFEPRYRQLIGECLQTNTTFGIPTYLGETLPGHGCEMRVTELVTAHADGTMDISTVGIRVFEITDFVNPVPNKLYAGGTVEFMEMPDPSPSVLPDLIEKVTYLYKLLNTPLKANEALPQPYSYQIAHAIGLGIEEEYELLTIPKEFDRQVFLLAHLNHVIPIMEEMERTRERIRMNGHFREFGELNF